MLSNSAWRGGQDNIFAHTNQPKLSIAHSASALANADAISWQNPSEAANHRVLPCLDNKNLSASTQRDRDRKTARPLRSAIAEASDRSHHSTALAFAEQFDLAPARPVQFANLTKQNIQATNLYWQNHHSLDRPRSGHIKAV